MILIYSLLPDTTLSDWDYIIKTAPALTPIIAFFAALVAYKAFRRQRKLHQEKLSFDFEFFYQNDKELKEHREKIHALLKKEALTDSYLEILAEKKNENENGLSIMFVLNTWERCAHAIKEGLFDEDYIYNYVSDIAIKNYLLLKPFINARIKNGSPSSYIDFRWLAHRWMLRKAIEVNDHAKLPALLDEISHGIAMFALGKREKKHLVSLYKKLGKFNTKGRC